jgi:hypothetical protein
MRVRFWPAVAAAASTASYVLLMPDPAPIEVSLVEVSPVEVIEVAPASPRHAAPRPT